MVRAFGLEERNAPLAFRALAVCTNVAVVVYDAGGQQLWEKSYNVGFQEYLDSIAPTEDGGCMLGWSPRDRLTLLRADPDPVR